MSRRKKQLAQIFRIATTARNAYQVLGKWKMSLLDWTGTKKIPFRRTIREIQSKWLPDGLPRRGYVKLDKATSTQIVRSSPVLEFMICSAVVAK